MFDTVRQKQTVVFKCPSGLYCNHKPTEEAKKGIRLGKRPTMSFGGSKGKVTVEYCRFCTRIKEGAFTCVLHNEVLSVDDGWRPLKTMPCRLQSHQVIEDIQEEEVVKETAQIDPRMLMSWTMDKFFLQYNILVKQGYPPDLCTKVAKEYVMNKDSKVDMVIDMKGDE